MCITIPVPNYQNPLLKTLDSYSINNNLKHEQK
jgi:hypothetical protein